MATQFGRPKAVTSWGISVINLRWLLTGAVLLGCSSSATGPGNPNEGTVRVVNGTPQALAFFVVAADLAPLLDPAPEAFSEPWVHVVPPGADRLVDEVSGREEARKGGLAVYLYELTTGGTRVRFTRVQMASGTEIQRAGRRIVIRELGS